MAIVTITPPSPSSTAAQILFSLRGANMQSTSDQIFTKLFGGTNYRITDIMAVRASGGASVTCAGGIYDAASKGGNPLVAAAQSWVTLAANVNVAPTVAAINNTALTSGVPYLSLTTGSTAACTANIFIVGYCLD